MERLTEKHWRNLDPWECCGQDHFCGRGCHDLGGCTNGCIVPKLYAHLASYEDTNLTPEEIMAAASRRHDCKIDCLLEAHNKLLDEVQSLGGIDKIREVIQAPNDPLTLKELRTIYDGEEGAVWVKFARSIWPAILDVFDGKLVAVWSALGHETGLQEDCYGVTWLAYRRKPEEEAE